MHSMKLQGIPLWNVFNEIQKSWRHVHSVAIIPHLLIQVSRYDCPFHAILLLYDFLCSRPISFNMICGAVCDRIYIMMLMIDRVVPIWLRMWKMTKRVISHPFVTMNDRSWSRDLLYYWNQCVCSPIPSLSAVTFIGDLHAHSYIKQMMFLMSVLQSLNMLPCRTLLSM